LQSLQHFENAFFSKNEHIRNLVDSIHDLRLENASESLDLLYSQIRKKQDDVDNYRTEMNQIRNDYNFYNLDSHMEILNKSLTEARTNYTGESGKYEVYLENELKDDTLMIYTQARIEAAYRNIEDLESEIEKLEKG